jgi:Gpi18-like mannosyltransferase
VIGEALSQGRDIYADSELVPRYPYLPLQMYLSFAAYYIDENITGGFLFLCKLPSIFGDIAVILLLYRITLYLSNNYNRAFFASLTYAICPIPITVSAYHGQFDSITLAFLLASLYAYYRQQPLLSSLWFSVSITTKIWPVIFIPLFVLLLHNNRDRFRFLLLVPVVPIASITFYCLLVNGNPILVVKTTLEYGGGVLGYWGIGAVIDIILRPAIYNSYHLIASLSFRTFAQLAEYM